jgi:hypothetical protein
VIFKKFILLSTGLEIKFRRLNIASIALKIKVPIMPRAKREYSERLVKKLSKNRLRPMTVRIRAIASNPNGYIEYRSRIKPKPKASQMPIL